MVRGSIPGPAAGTIGSGGHPTTQSRPGSASPYARLAASYVQRKSLWAPAAAYAAYLAVLILGPGWTGEPGNGLGRTTQAMLANVGAIIYLITSSLSLGSHLREQLTNPRAPLMPGFVRMHRVVAGGWLALVILLPALIVWLVGAPALATRGSSWPLSLVPILAGAVGVGLWTGYLLPWGLLLPMGAFIVYLPLQEAVSSPVALSAISLLGCAAAVALLGMQSPKDGSSSATSARLTVNSDRIEVLSDLSSGLLPRLLLHFDEHRFQAPPAWIGEGFLARVFHRKRSLPVVRWSTLALIGVPMAWLLATMASVEKLQLERSAASRRGLGSDVIWSSRDSSSAFMVGLAIIVVVVLRELSTWIAAGQARKQLGYESMRSGPRTRFLLEVGAAWYLAGLRPVLVAAVLPSIGSLLYYGLAGRALEMAWWLACADVLIFAASLYERLMIWKDGLVKGLLFSIIYLSVFMGSGAALILWPGAPAFLSVAWLAAAAIALAGLYRWLRTADL